MARKRLPPKPPNTLRPGSNQSPGAPPLDISVDEVRRLARLGLTGPLIAEFFGCSVQTIHNRVSHSEIVTLRQERPNKLREAMYQRAMGGRYEEKQPDGTILVKFSKGSERMMELASKYLIGPPPQVLEINPDPGRPANVRHTVDPEQLKEMLRGINEDF